MQRVNVIYLTTRCNLDCCYCYEAHKRRDPNFEHKDITKDEIDNFVDDIENRESNLKSSTVVVMGGEPTLRMDLCEYLFTKLTISGQKHKKTFAVTFTTNGILLYKREFLLYITNLFRYFINKGYCFPSLEISYDGTGQILRAFPNGSSTNDILLHVLNELNNIRYKFKISYTVQHKNYQYVIQDVHKLYSSYTYLNKIKLSFAYMDIDKHTYSGYGYQLRNHLIHDAEDIFILFNKPLCELSCNICQQCNKSLFEGFNYLSPTRGFIKRDMINVSMFDQF